MKRDVNQLLTFPTAVKRAPAVDAWFERRTDHLGAIAYKWFDVMRNCGDDVRELIHDLMPTACVGEVAFCYVNAFTSHVNVGFFCGSELDDPAGLLEGTGKFMRHVKMRPKASIDEADLTALIVSAYFDVRQRRSEH
ncbi:MAG TPA: DUF1801 domain-containing protein [Pyrinomonadaceae bacterium]|nr:DUF1801 domain-containing protein [Pyrinomonadaceae bacterium]